MCSAIVNKYVLLNSNAFGNCSIIYDEKGKQCESFEVESVHNIIKARLSRYEADILS